MTDLSIASGDRARLDVPFALASVERVTKDDGDEVGIFEGLASTFGNKDLYGDIIEPGAFKQTIKGNLKRIKMLWQHNTDEPIGIWTEIEENEKGLRVKGELLMDLQRSRDALVLMKAGAIDALSIGFRIPEKGAEWDEDGVVRRIKKIDLWEISAVTFPANPKARISRVKAADDHKTIREFETWLRDAAGYSRAEATTIAERGWKALARDDAGAQDETAAKPRDEDNAALMNLVAAETRRAEAITQHLKAKVSL